MSTIGFFIGLREAVKCPSFDLNQLCVYLLAAD